MTILIADERGTDVHRFEEEHLFVDHHYHNSKVARYIDQVWHKLEGENDTDYFVYSFGCGIDLTNLDPAWQ
jgi:hypothetical protein